jgi:hypothetical protein
MDTPSFRRALLIGAHNGGVDHLDNAVVSLCDRVCRVTRNTRLLQSVNRRAKPTCYWTCSFTAFGVSGGGRMKGLDTIAEHGDAFANLNPGFAKTG